MKDLIFPVVKIFKFEHWTEAEIPPGLAVSVGSLKNTYLEKFGEFTTSCFLMLYKVFILFVYYFFVYEYRKIWLSNGRQLSKHLIFYPCYKIKIGVLAQQQDNL